MFAKAPLANQGNDVQAKFAMRQGPAPFFFWSVNLMEAGTTWLNTLPDHQGQFPHPREGGHGAMAVIGHRQRLATLLTVHLQRGQGLCLRRFGARSSSSHALSPVGIVCLLLLPGYTCRQSQFAIQPRIYLAYLITLPTPQAGLSDRGGILAAAAQQGTIATIATAQSANEPAALLWIVITLVIALSAIIGMLILFGRKRNQE